MFLGNLFLQIMIKHICDDWFLSYHIYHVYTHVYAQLSKQQPQLPRLLRLPNGAKSHRVQLPRGSFSWFHDWSTYPHQTPKTYPRNSRPLWSGLINHWFPWPLFLRGVTLGASTLRFESGGYFLTMKFFWEFLNYIVKIHDVLYLGSKKHNNIPWFPPKKWRVWRVITRWSQSLKCFVKHFCTFCAPFLGANPLRGWWVGPGPWGWMCTSHVCWRQMARSEKQRVCSPLRRGSRKQLRLIYAIVYKVFICLSCFSD